MKTCREVMTSEPICCLPEDTVDQVARIMKRENIGSLPVVANYFSNKLIGIVTDRDLAVRVVAGGNECRQVLVQSIMTMNPTTCQPDDPLEKALSIMSKCQLRRIPIVDEENVIVGIIAQADVAIQSEDSEQIGDVVEQISQPTGNLS